MENIRDSDNPVVKWYAVLLKMASIADVFLWVLGKCSGDPFYGKNLWANTSETYQGIYISSNLNSNLHLLL